MWIVWKTQDSCGRGLWKTRGGRLLAGGVSDRIGDAVRGAQMAAVTLKTPAQTAWPRSDHIDAPVALPEFSTTDRGRRGHRRPLFTDDANGTFLESTAGVRYTPCLALRLLRSGFPGTDCPHVWKALWIDSEKRR